MSGPARIDLTDPAYWQDTHAVLAAARARHPLALSTTGQPWVLRAGWVEKLSSDPRVDSGALAVLTDQGVDSGPVWDWWRLMLTNLNGARHARLRGLVSRAFTPRAVQRLRPRIRALALELLEKHAAPGRTDIVSGLAHELPSRIMCELLGVDPDDHEEFAGWSTQLGSVLAAVITPELLEQTEPAVRSLYAYVRERIAERRARPRDDLLGALVGSADADDELYDDEELVVLAINLLFGGHDSSRSLIAVALMLLLCHPDQLEAVRRDPGLVAGAVDEILRHEPVIGSMGRVVHTDIEVEGHTIAAGTPIMLSVLAANRDPELFDDPDRFDVTRPARRAFGFGWGSHVCLGAALARAELQEVIPVILERCRSIELEIDAPRWVPFTFIRKLESLPVRVELR